MRDQPDLIMYDTTLAVAAVEVAAVEDQPPSMQQYRLPLTPPPTPPHSLPLSLPPALLFTSGGVSDCVYMCSHLGALLRWAAVERQSHACDAGHEPWTAGCDCQPGCYAHDGALTCLSGACVCVQMCADVCQDVMMAR